MKADRYAVSALAILAAVLSVTFVVYLPGLSGPLLLDDIPQLDGLIKNSAIDPATLFNNFIVSTSGPSGRPIAMATFIGNAIAHGPDTWWWKYSNLMFHMICGLLAFWLTALLFRTSATKAVVDPWIAGAIVAGLWLLHPLQVSTVLYTVQRMTELSTLFVLAGLVCYAKGRLIQEKAAGIGWLLIGVGFVVFYPLAVFSKENALIYPVFCSLIELLVFRFRGSEPLRRQVKIFHSILLAGYIAGGAFVLANFSSIVLEDYATRDFTISERVLTQFRVIVLYLSMLLLPIQRNMGFFHDDLQLSTGLFEPFTTMPSALFLLALFASAIALRRKLPLYALGILFFFVSHVIESSVMGLELMFEHRNYMGSLGVLIALMSIALLATDYRRGLAVIAAISLVGFSLLTWQRSLTWSSPDYLYPFIYRAHPESSRINLIYANASTFGKDYKGAYGFLDKVEPGFGVELHRLLLDCLEHRRLDDKALSSISRIGDGVINVYTASSADLLIEEVASGRCDASRKSLVDALDHILASPSRSATERVLLMFTTARLLESMGQIDPALDQYLAAQELLGTDALPLYKATATLIRAGRLDQARAMLTRASEFNSSTRMQRNVEAKTIYSALGMAYESAGQFDEALAVYAQAVTSMPRQSLFYVRTAKLLLDMQRYDDAKRMLDDIRSLDLIDLEQYEYAMKRIATEVERGGQ